MDHAPVLQHIEHWFLNVINTRRIEVMVCHIEGIRKFWLGRVM